jgi:hypothetical protein
MKQDAEAYSSNGIGAGQFNGSSGKYGLKRRIPMALYGDTLDASLAAKKARTRT